MINIVDERLFRFDQLKLGDLERPVDEAKALYSNRALVDTAAAVIYKNDRALEYLKTAPVLILGLSYGKTFKRSVEFGQVAGMFRNKVERGPKLRDLMDGYGIAPQMRKISGKALSPNKYDIIRKLTEYVNPSALSQAIPEKSYHQHLWLYACDRWWKRHVQTLAQRANPKAPNFEWAASRLNRFTDQGQLSVVTDLMDFCRHPEVRFDEKWTFDQAIEAMHRWHELLGKMDASQKFKASHGIEYEEEFHYKDFADATELSGLKFIALNSGMRLHAEGRAMHHCVSTYTGPCIQGRYAIFSILGKKDKRLGTLGYRREGDWWIFDQLKGPCNRVVDRYVADAVTKFTADYRKNRTGK